MFAESDEDGDGSLSLDEFSAFGENMRAQGAPPGGGPGGIDGPPPGPPPDGSQQSSETDLLSSLTGNSSSIMDLLSSEETDGASMYAQLLSSLAGTDSSADGSQFTSSMQKLLTQAYSAGTTSVS